MAVSAPEAGAPVVLLAPDDDVVTCVGPIPAGTDLCVPGGRTVRSLDDIPAGHKVALRALPAGTPVRKYGQPIGVATADIAEGAHVHVHNLASDRAGGPR